MKTRAIENCTGDMNNENHVGNTNVGNLMAIDKNRYIVEEVDNQEEIITAEVDIQKVAEQQQFKKRRADVYKYTS